MDPVVRIDRSAELGAEVVLNRHRRPVAMGGPVLSAARALGPDALAAVRRDHPIQSAR